MPKRRYASKNIGGQRLAVINQANAICEEYEALGYELTLRQLYYQFVARGLIPNSDREYKKLGDIIADGRMAGLIDWNHIVDRTRYLRDVSTWENPSAIMRGAARGYQIDLWDDQDTRVEVWIEKDALVGVVERACASLRVPFLSCRGYTSASEMWGAAQRIGRHIDSGRDVTIVHLGDHDPSGIDMSRDIEDRIVNFIANDRYRESGFSDDDVFEWAHEHFTVDRVALNWDQVQAYDPPPNPAKLTDSRGAGYVDRFGNQSWELDALAPDVISGLIEDTVIALRDEDLWADALERENAERLHLTLAATKWGEVTGFLDGLAEANDAE